MRKIALSLLLATLCFSSFAAKNGIGLVRGFAGVSGMNGFAVTFKSYWGDIFHFDNGWGFRGLWDFNLGYWQARKAADNFSDHITIATVTPTLRFGKQLAYDGRKFAPFFDLGFGIGVMTDNRFARQQLGSYATFKRTIGFGVNFGPESQYDISYHYQSYDNAGQFDHDDGLFLNTLSFTYRF